MRSLLFTVAVFLVVFSCRDMQERPKVDYNNNEGQTLTIEDVVSDTTKAIVATLPLCFDSTNVLIQPSGLVNIRNIKDLAVLDRISYPSENKSSYRGKSSESDFHVSGIYGNELSGQMTNVYFDDLSTNTQRLLTTDYIFMSRITYLREIAKNTDKHYLLYFVYDKDTNRDGKLNSQDILSLYISKLDGTGFSKITSDNHELLNYRPVPFANRYYFTTIEDINKDGYFNKGDKYNYYYIDFSVDPYKIVEYKPTL